LTDLVLTDIFIVMFSLAEVTTLKSKQKLDLNLVPDGVFAVFTGSLNTKLATTQIAYIDESIDLITSQHFSIYYATTDNIDVNSDKVLYDPNKEFAAQCSILGQKKDQCEALMYFIKSGEKLKHILTREMPESKYNWVTQIAGFAKNYKTNTPDMKNLWRFGQKILVTGEYLCVDCGYIENFESGDLFPICEVCRSGDPAGPTDGTDQGYWEILN
jgi:hypothetical protein